MIATLLTTPAKDFSPPRTPRSQRKKCFFSAISAPRRLNAFTSERDQRNLRRTIDAHGYANRPQSEVGIKCQVSNLVESPRIFSPAPAARARQFLESRLAHRASGRRVEDRPASPKPHPRNLARAPAESSSLRTEYSVAPAQCPACPRARHQFQQARSGPYLVEAGLNGSSKPAAHDRAALA